MSVELKPPEVSELAGLARRAINSPAPDAEAEAQLCRAFGPRIRLFGARHLRDSAATADFVQDVLLVLLGALREGRVRDPDRIDSFVLGTCRLIARDRHRERERRDVLLVRFVADLIRENVAPPTPIDRDQLGRCLDGLPPRQRQVVFDTFLVGRTVDEVAQTLETTPGNVRVLRHRGVTGLRICLERKGGLR